MALTSTIAVLLFFCLMTSTNGGMFFSYYKREQCKPLEISSCRKLGYNKTHASTDMYSIMPLQEVKKYIALLDSIKCSRDVLFFMCTMYSPVCFAGYVPRVLPCRSVCESVKKGCLPYVKLAGFAWPSELDCEKLPDYNTGVCIQPSAIVAKSGGRRKKNLSTDKSEKCKKCTTLKHPRRYKKFKKASYVIQAEVKLRITRADKETKLIVKVSRVYKQGKVKINRKKTMRIWSATKCICPRIEFDKKYIIIGQEDKRKKRLLYDHKSVILESTADLERKLLKWKAKYRKLRARKAKRKSNTRANP
eukprot:gene16857-18556_t